MSSRRERVRQAAIEEIKSIAWKIINEQGITEVTVHAIAKQMGMTPPAFYSYFKSREALMKSLVLDAYESFQSALESARDSLPEEKMAKQILAIYIAYREWAITHPALFGLFAGREVPGFNPPEEDIVKKSDTMVAIFFEVYQKASKAGLLTTPDKRPPLPESYRTQISKLKQQLKIEIAEEVINSMIHIAFLVHGIISMEISGRYQHMLNDFSQLYVYQVSNELKKIGLDPD